MSETTTDTTEAATDEAVTEDTAAPQEGNADNEGLSEIPTDDAWDPDRALSKIKKLNAEVVKAKAKIAAAEEKAKGVDEKDQQISALEAKTLRLDVALDLGLPRQIADRLKGNTREEMLADAEELMQLLNPKTTTRKPVEALRGGGEPDTPPEERDLDKLADRMFRR